MKPSELWFSFGGYNSRADFGLTFVPDALSVGEAVERNEYEIAGVSGSVLFDGEKRSSYKLSGTLYALGADAATLASQARVCFMLEKVVDWLKGGRQALTLGWEDDYYMLAQVDGALEWSYKTFIDGGLKVTFTVQPYRYLKRLDEASVTVTGGRISQALTLGGSQRAPLGARITNKGLNTIVAARLNAGGKTIILSGFSLETGDSLLIQGEPPVGATLVVDGEPEDALGYITRFDEVTLSPGENTVVVTVMYGAASANGAAYTEQTAYEAYLYARGRR